MIEEKQIQEIKSFFETKKGKYTLYGFIIGVVIGLLYKLVIVTGAILVGGLLIQKIIKKKKEGGDEK